VDVVATANQVARCDLINSLISHRQGRPWRGPQFARIALDFFDNIGA